MDVHVAFSRQLSALSETRLLRACVLLCDLCDLCVDRREELRIGGFVGPAL